MIAPDRPRISLDGAWSFVRDPERRCRPETLPEGEPIRVPGCWEAQLDRPFGIVCGWYRRTIRLPAAWATGGGIRLRFGGVGELASVWLDGVPLGEHVGTWTAFELDASPAARPGHEQELVVRVLQPLNALEEYPTFDVEKLAAAELRVPELSLTETPSGKQHWYASLSGLWSSVHAEFVPEPAIERLRVRPTPVEGGLELRWTAVGDVSEGRLEVAVRDAAGRLVGEAVASLPESAGGGRAQGRLVVPLADLHPWSPDDPHRYWIDARLIVANEVVDRWAGQVGLRTIETRNGEIYLNGRRVTLRGALDQGIYPATIWTAPSATFLAEEMRRVRALGLNLLRCHIKVPEPEYLEAADAAGILLWCELPSWLRSSPGGLARARATLLEVVDQLGDHPSIVAWTVVNEDWGTRLRDEARDRRWLADTVALLRKHDPDRLVVDNSACETPGGPNFHLDTDLADFHLYRAWPEHADRWRQGMDELASRPSWLWSPYGDATMRGNEPIILSEFGLWGLPRPSDLTEAGSEPWWFRTGHGVARPTGLIDRFRDAGLDRVWPDVDAFAAATQRHQLAALEAQIREIRRRPSMAGYVITELSDAFWEANGLRGLDRSPKGDEGVLARLNGSPVIFAALDRHDVWATETLRVVLSVAADEPPIGAGRLAAHWRIEIGSTTLRSGRALFDWPDRGAGDIGALDLAAPDVEETSDACFHADLVADGRVLASTTQRFVVVPRRRMRTDQPIAIAVHDPDETWRIADRLRVLGHSLTDVDRASVIVAAVLEPSLLDLVERGGRLLWLVRARQPGVAASRRPSDVPDTSALLPLQRPLRIHPRSITVDSDGLRHPWDGDWITTWCWLVPGVAPDLPDRAPLDATYAEVLPDHVLLGARPEELRSEVLGGVIAGWAYPDAATVWAFSQGRGRVVATTLRLSPESGPVATCLLEGLLQRLAGLESGPSVRRKQGKRRLATRVATDGGR